DFEAGELEELFADDMPRAALPREGPTAHIRAMSQAFLEGPARQLRGAAATKDRAAFADAFRHAAEMCNACHQASDKRFIEVPSIPGNAVPSLDPVPYSRCAPLPRRS